MIVLHGPPKVGKTQFASRFPGPIWWLATEVGHKFIPEDQKKNILLIDPSSWDEFKHWLDQKHKAKTYVVDTISGLYHACFNYVCDKNNWSHASDGAHGKGWAAVKKEFLDVLTKFTFIANKFGSTIILIDHTKVETVETTTSQIEKVVCSMPGQARGVVLPIPDHIWFLGYDEPTEKDAFVAETAKRCLFVKGSGAVEAGTRDTSIQVNRIRPLSKTNPYKQVITKLYQK